MLAADHYNASETGTDPVCGMSVERAKTAGTSNYGGKAYFFCSNKCLEKFKADPEKYLKKGSNESTGRKKVKEEIYICPMHPEVIKDGPDACPICGMALEPKVATGEEEGGELADISRRF